MNAAPRLSLVLLFALLPQLIVAQSSRAADWSVPVAGNAFRTAPGPGRDGLRRGGTLAWNDPQEVFSIYFHVDRPATLRIAFKGRVREGKSILAVKVGDKAFETTVEGADLAEHPVGDVDVSQAGYVRVDLQGSERSGNVYAEIESLQVSSSTESLQLDYVKTNQGNMFYWGRRGPSVHLRYQVPQDKSLRYAYSEVTVPVGQDPIGSYFMANGFGEGYFGIQVNSEDERRILFSVWSPFKTDNPQDIPPEQQITTLGKGPDVHIGQFGNEGSGGQSYLVYPWKAGTTYRFLTEVKPDGQGGTHYTSWFSEKESDSWRLVASFRRPQTDTHLTRFHSFLENFAPQYGYIGRRALYGNVWVCDTQSQWSACTAARFSVDATGGGRHRLDFSGGVDGDVFYLRNGGFFDETGQPGETFTRTTTTDAMPVIDFDALPR
ncbi:DUF3472 domain-containing protein [Stieleria sp. TO1_6]|nr:DUF3472 domain-containing protein [Stieleria tagensis]